MKSQKLFKKLTESQRNILAQVSQDGEVDKLNLEEVLVNVKVQIDNEILSNEYGLSEERCEDYREVYRYLNSIKDDEETRKENLIEFAIKKYQGIQAVVNKSIETERMNITNIIKYGYEEEREILSVIGIYYGFTDREVKKILKNMDINFKGINWEEVEVVD